LQALDDSIIGREMGDAIAERGGRIYDCLIFCFKKYCKITPAIAIGKEGCCKLSFTVTG